MTIVICEDQEKVNIFIAEAFLVSDVYRPYCHGILAATKCGISRLRKTILLRFYWTQHTNKNTK